MNRTNIQRSLFGYVLRRFHTFIRTRDGLALAEKLADATTCDPDGTVGDFRQVLDGEVLLLRDAIRAHALARVSGGAAPVEICQTLADYLAIKGEHCSGADFIELACGLLEKARFNCGGGQ